MLALRAERHKLGEMGVIEAITRGEPIGSSLMRCACNIPEADEHDGRNAPAADLFCEKYFEANPGKNVIYATCRTPDLFWLGCPTPNRYRSRDTRVCVDSPDEGSATAVAQGSHIVPSATQNIAMYEK